MKRKTISISIVFNVVYRVLNIFFPLITATFLSRILGPTNLGKVSYSQSIMSYFLVFSSLGIPTYGMREIAKVSNNPCQLSKTFCELFYLNFISSFICSAIYTYLIFRIKAFAQERLLFFYTGVTLYLNIFNVDWAYLGMEEHVYITIRSFCLKILSIIAIFVFIKNSEDYTVYALLLSLATAGNYVLNVLNLRHRIHFTFRNIEFKKHIKPVMILLVTLLASDVYTQMDVTMLGSIKTQEEVGYYSNGIKLARMVYTIPQAIGATIIPRLSFHYGKEEYKEFKELFWSITNVIWIIAIPSSVGLFILSPEIVKCIFGDQFIPTISVVRLLSVQATIVSLSFCFGSIVLTASNNENRLLIATFSGCMVNLILNSLLIPKIGMTGAAIASIAAEIAVFIVHFAYGFPIVKRRINGRDILSVLFGTVVMTVVLILIRKYVDEMILILIIGIVCSVLVYFLVLLVLKNSFSQKCLDWIKEKGLHSSIKND